MVIATRYEICAICGKPVFVPTRFSNFPFQEKACYAKSKLRGESTAYFHRSCFDELLLNKEIIADGKRI